MARIPERWDGPNQWYFVTITTRQRRPVFVDAATCEALKQAFHETHQYYRFRLAALVILPDHWHGLIRPDDGVVIEDVVGTVKRNTLKKLGKRSSFWHPRFMDHRIRDEQDFENHVQYIRGNPVKHGVAETPEAYPWLFFHSQPFGYGGDGILMEKWRGRNPALPHNGGGILMRREKWRGRNPALPMGRWLPM